MSLTCCQDLQKRFLELQALLVKYQTNGKTPSPQKSMKSPVNEEKEKHQVWFVIFRPTTTQQQRLIKQRLLKPNFKSFDLVLTLRSDTGYKCYVKVCKVVLVFEPG